MMRAFYNEIDRYCCDWLSNLMDAGHITAGKIDDRSILDLGPDDVRGYECVHFFAGIGGWDHALNLAQWGSRPVWTGSCPCQPLSGAGQRKGDADERHLWPAFYRLIAECKPATLFGEQVASKDGREWLAAVRSDLEALGYACGAADLCAAGVGAPHIRQRLWFVAHACSRGRRLDGRSPEGRGDQPYAFKRSVDGVLADTAGPRRDAPERARQRDGGAALQPAQPAECGPCELADANGGNTSAAWLQRGGQHGLQPEDGFSGEWPRGSYGDDSGHATGCKGDCGRSAWCCGGSCCALPDECDGNNCALADAAIPRRDALALGSAGTHGRQAEEPGRLCDAGGLADNCSVGSQDGRIGREQLETKPPGCERDAIERSCRLPWSDLVWLPCTDGKARPVKPGIFPLAHGLPNRVAQLRAAGNAIIPQVAAEFIKAAML